MNRHFLLAFLLTALLAIPATAQVRLGVRGGLTLGEMRFDRDVINSDNRVGYTGGLLLDLNIPVIGLGAEVGVMYAHRKDRLTDGQIYFKRHYFEIPVYARYRLSLTSLERIFAPYIFTGPSFSILFNENAPTNYKNSKTYLSWDVGAGVELFRHLRLSASYDIGISKAMEYIDKEYDGQHIEGKDRHWTINAAYLF